MINIDKHFFNSTFGTGVEKLEDVDLNTEKGRRDLQLKAKDYVAKTFRDTQAINSNLDEMDKRFKDQVARLQSKVDKTIEKVRGALLSERGTSGAIYTTQIPLNRQQTTETTTTRIEEGIAFGVPNHDDVHTSEITYLTLKNLSFNSNINLNYVNRDRGDDLKDFKLSTHTQTDIPIEFKIVLTGVVRTSSSLIIEMTEHKIVEIYINNQLYKEKGLVKDLILPIDINTMTVGLRFYPNIHRSNTIHFKRIGYTELIYNTATYLETKNISINKDLYQIVIDTCDNSNDRLVTIDYAISINDEPFEAISPVQKHKAIEKQSIITLDKTQVLNMYKSDIKKVNDGDYRFYVPNNLQTNLIYEHPIYFKNVKGITNQLLYVSIKEDVVLNATALLQHIEDKVYVNSSLVEDNFTLYKGIATISVVTKKGDYSNINLDYLNNLVGKENIYISKQVKPVLTDIDYLKYVSFTYKELLDTDTKEAYFPGIKPKRNISTLKLRAELKSLDKRTVPFISRILVRGI